MVNDTGRTTQHPNYAAMSQSAVNALGIGRCCGCRQYAPLTELARVPSLDGRGNRYHVERAKCARGVR